MVFLTLQVINIFADADNGSRGMAFLSELANVRENHYKTLHAPKVC